MISIGEHSSLFFARLLPYNTVLASIFLRPMLAPIHRHTAAPCPVLDQEHTNDACNIPTASSPPERFPCASPLPHATATPHPPPTPPRGEGHPPILQLSAYIHFRVMPALDDRRLSVTGGSLMDVHRHSAMELPQRKSRERQQGRVLKGLAADTRPCRGRRRLGWSCSVGFLGLIGLLGLLGLGAATLQGQGLLDQLSPPLQAPEPSRHAT
jgi:hypothetical protein